MTTRLFVNLPVGDLQESIEFFTKLGFTFNRSSPTKPPPAWSSATKSP